MELKPHQQRVLEEQRELYGRISRLSQFLIDAASSPSTVDRYEFERLSRQLTVMLDLNKILLERIGAFFVQP